MDLISPMLYHRVLDKPISYISDYVKYLHQLGYGNIVPIIQVKDMPDDLPDNYLPREVSQAFREAIKPPSAGVAFFSWDHAVEKIKQD